MTPHNQKVQDEMREMIATLNKVKSETPRVFNSLKTGSMLRTDSLTGISNETFPTLISFVESIHYDQRWNTFYIGKETSKKFHSVVDLIEANDISEHLDLYEFGTTKSYPGPRIPITTAKSRHLKGKDFVWIVLLDSTPFRCNMDQKANANMTEHLKQFYPAIETDDSIKLDYNCFYKVLVVETSRVIWIDVYDLYKMVHLCVERSLFKAFKTKTAVDYIGDVVL